MQGSTGRKADWQQGTWKQRRERWGAYLWLSCAQFFVCEALATLGWPGHYSYRFNFISDLGAQQCGHACSHWHALMNASFLVQGVLIAGGALLLPRGLSPGWLGRCARVLFLLAALGMVAIAFAPEDVDQNLHIAGARLHFLCGPLGMVAWGLACRARRPVRTAIAVAALVATAIALLGNVLIFYGNSQTSALLGIGTIERIAVYPFPLWLAWTGFMLLRSSAMDARQTGQQQTGKKTREQARDL